MREKIRFRLAIYMEFQNGRRTLCVIALVAACMLLFLYSILMEYASEYHRLSADKIFTEGVERTGVIMIETAQGVEQMETVTEELRKLPCIKSIAQSVVTGISVREYEQYPNGGLLLEQADENGNISAVSVSRDAANVCHMELLWGTPPEELPIEEEGVITGYIYLGYDYRDIPLGEVGERVLLDGTKYRMVIAGVLQKGQKWMPQNAYAAHGLGYTSLSDYVETDSSLIVYSGKISAYPVFFNFTEEYTFEEVKNAGMEVANKYGVELSLASCAEKYKIVHAERRVILDALKECLILMVLTACSLILCIQITEFYQNKRQYGLFYALGMTGEDVEHIVVWRKLCETAFAALLSYLLMFILAQRLFWAGSNAQKVISEVLTIYCLPRLFIFSIVVVVISAGVSIIFMRRYMPTELLTREE